MDKYLKMADVFDLDCAIASRISIQPTCVWSSYDDGVTPREYASHAINSHDELVAEVERLRCENDALMKCRMAAREFFNTTVASGGVVKVSSYSKDAPSDADKASDWLEKELKETDSLVK